MGLITPKTKFVGISVGEQILCLGFIFSISLYGEMPSTRTPRRSLQRRRRRPETTRGRDRSPLDYNNERVSVKSASSTARFTIAHKLSYSFIRSSPFDDSCW